MNKEINNVSFDINNHEFTVTDKHSPIDYSTFTSPLSIVVQVTRECDLECKFCSESLSFPNPSFTDLLSLSDKLASVRRIYFSGGEPLLRDDIFDLIESFHRNNRILGLATNSIHLSPSVCKNLKRHITYINAGLDGPRFINNNVRGAYDSIISGLMNLREENIDVSLSTVILRNTYEHISYVIQIADVLGVKKVKLAMPVSRGRAKNLPEDQFVSEATIYKIFDELVRLKNLYGWHPRIKTTIWGPKTEGYALLVFPDQNVHAWPVLDQNDCILKIGSLKEESIFDIWNRYPFKENHINKYSGTTVMKG